MSKTSRMKDARDSAMKKVDGGRAAVGEVVAGMVSEGFSRDEAVGALVSLQEEKKVAIEEKAPYSSLGSYAWSPVSLWFWAAVGAIAISLALISVTSGAVLYLRYVFGSALVLFIPGYALIEALYPKRELDELTRVALSIGLSLALVPLAGLVLNYTPFGIRLLPVAISIAGMSVIFLIVALVRKHAYYRLAKGVT
jgi:hypothetical protein